MHIEYIRTVLPGICEVRNTRTNASHFYKGWADQDDMFTADTTPDGEWIEVHFEFGECGCH